MPATITPDNFTDYVPPLKKEAVKLFEISIGGTLLTPREVDVQLNEEGDAVDFTIIYPRPASGAVRIAPVYIKLLPDDGYATALTVYDDARNILNAGETLNTESPTYDLASPPPAKPAASPAPGKIGGEECRITGLRPIGSYRFHGTQARSHLRSGRDLGYGRREVLARDRLGEQYIHARGPLAIGQQHRPKSCEHDYRNLRDDLARGLDKRDRR